MPDQLAGLRIEFMRLSTGDVAHLDQIVLHARARHGFQGSLKEAECLLRATGEFKLEIGQEGWMEVRLRPISFRRAA